MLQPFLLVGVGGSGGKTLRALRHSLELRLQQEDWREGWPKAWQLLHIDSPVSQDGAAFPAPFLPAENYLGLVAPGTTYKQAYGKVMANIPARFLPDIEKPMPSDKDVAVQVNIGAGKFRAIGRTLVLAKLAEVSDAVADSFGRMMSDGALSQLDSLGRKLGAKPASGEPNPIVIVISSIAGGSGAGQYIEVTEAIKHANRNAPWIHSIFSILYAPDVFKSVGNTDVIAPNALFAMAESMAGMWSRDLPESTQELYKKIGIEIPGLGSDPKVHIGPKFNYIIGRQNSKVSFDDQPDVYKAVSASLSTWLTDENVQDGLQAYTVANYSADMGAMSLTDNSGLQVANVHTPPFGSLGFGRVSLGRDNFSDYAGERLSRTAIDRMLNAHDKDENIQARTTEQWVELKASQAFGDFEKDLKFTHKTETQIELVDLNRPERDALLADFKSQLLQIASQGVSAKTGTQPTQAWSDALTTAYTNRIEAFVDAETQARNEKIQLWVKSIRNESLRVTARSISQLGLKVSIELLKRVDEDIASQIGLMTRLRETYKTYANDYSSAINASLQAIQGGQGIKSDHIAISEALENAKNCLWYQFESQLLENVASLIADFAANYLKPLRDAISQGESALLKRTDKQEESEHIQNAYLSWPKPDSDSVPPKYKVAPNEYLLVETSDYPKEYNRLIQESVRDDKRENARQVVTDEVLIGALELENLDPDQSWQLITESKSWIPVDSSARTDRSQSQQAARFDFSTDPDEYLKRSQFWMQRKGQAFHKYLHEDLASYLDANIHDQSLIVDRIRKFREQFMEASRASEPLVKLNPGLLQEVHNASIEDRETVLSALPFDLNGEVFNTIKNILVQQKIWRDQTSEKWFNPSAHVQSIDIFSVQKPYQPMVMDSIFGPIAESWNKAQNNKDKRSNFLQWRRSRALFETVPAAPEKKRAMIRGWYVARILGQLQETIDDPIRGPHLKVWSGKDYEHVSFPFPLANEDIVEPHDYPGAILNSLTIALAMCNSESSLKPLYAYQRLIELGEIDNVANSELSLWITKGSLRYNGQPTPTEQRAGNSSDSVENRRLAVDAYLKEMSLDFTAKIEKLDPRDDWKRLNLTWEIRLEIRSALDSLIKAAHDAKEITSGI